MLLDPSGRALGMDAMLPYFQVLPFADVLFGVTLMLWICIQFYMFPPNGNRVQKVDPSCRGSGDSDRGPACQLLADKQQNDHP